MTVDTKGRRVLKARGDYRTCRFLEKKIEISKENIQN